MVLHAESRSVVVDVINRDDDVSHADQSGRSLVGHLGGELICRLPLSVERSCGGDHTSVSVDLEIRAVGKILDVKGVN